MGRDLISRPYGRFYYLPRYLAEQGHEVQILLLDYLNGEPLDEYAHGVRLISVPLKWYWPWSYISAIRRIVRESNPDWLIGLSDTYYGILARYFGKRYSIRSCIDAYDNYESYISWLKPLHWLWRNALKKADLVTAAGPELLELMSKGRSGKSSVVVPMAADPVGFERMDRQECRQRMGLPVDGKLIGYCGSLHKSRGVDVLFEAFEKLQKKYPGVSLVHSGRTWKNVRLPPFVNSMGYIDDEKMPALLNCMDVLVVTNKATSFGNYSYPVKLYEAMSCQIPVVVTETPATLWIMGEYPELLVKPDDADALCSALEKIIDSAGYKYYRVLGWDSSAAILECELLG